MNTMVGAAGVPLNNRTHRKLLIIDGRIGFNGGAGIAEHWAGNTQDDKHWRGLQIRLAGPAAQPLRTGFAPNWLECNGELVTGATAQKSFLRVAKEMRMRAFRRTTRKQRRGIAKLRRRDTQSPITTLG